MCTVYTVHNTWIINNHEHFNWNALANKIFDFVFQLHLKMEQLHRNWYGELLIWISSIMISMLISISLPGSTSVAVLVNQMKYLYFWSMAKKPESSSYCALDTATLIQFSMVDAMRFIFNGFIVWLFVQYQQNYVCIMSPQVCLPIKQNYEKSFRHTGEFS